LPVIERGVLWHSRAIEQAISFMSTIRSDKRRPVPASLEANGSKTALVVNDHERFGILVKPFGADELKRMVRGLAASV
jgi:hypothetical protein